MRHVVWPVFVCWVLIATAATLGVLYVDYYAEPQDTVLWGQVGGRWVQLYEEPTTMDECLAILTEVEKVYPNTYMICLDESIEPINEPERIAI